MKCRETGLTLLVARGSIHKHSDTPNLLSLLRFGDKRPCRRSTDKRYELAPPHSITSSARAINDCGTLRPSVLAVLRLIASSNVVGCNTGSSDGFAPLRIRPA
jgi:hypothetical protein